MTSISISNKVLLKIATDMTGTVEEQYILWTTMQSNLHVTVVIVSHSIFGNLEDFMQTFLSVQYVVQVDNRLATALEKQQQLCSYWGHGNNVLMT